MFLSASDFEGVVALLGSDAALGAGGQRREPRVLLDTRVTIVPCPDGVDGPYAAPLSVPVRDLSRGGMCFLLPRRLPLDTQFIAFLPRLPVTGGRAGELAEVEAASGAEADGRFLPVQCAIAYWQPLARNLFALGGQFVRVLRGVDVPAIEPRIVLPGMAAGEATEVAAAAQRAVG